jgi:D-glycerate 3-kinase
VWRQALAALAAAILGVAAVARHAFCHELVVRIGELAGSNREETLVLGICGSQGSGKSTLALALQRHLGKVHRRSAAILSLDDLYLSSSRRALLARDVHPLLKIRGVPGTHDLALGHDIIQGLRQAGKDDINRLPRFDKATDEPLPRQDWELFRGRADVIILEGWCVGALPQCEADMLLPINELERREDQDGSWRRYVNDQLAGPYRRLFASIDRLVMLCAPTFDVVLEWRTQQERDLARLYPFGPALMDADALKTFIEHYERITRHILDEMPGRADLVAHLDSDRRCLSIQER